MEERNKPAIGNTGSPAPAPESAVGPTLLLRSACAEDSLHKNIEVVRAISQIQPTPLAVRRIRKGYALDFPLGVPLDHLLNVSVFAGKNVTFSYPNVPAQHIGVINCEFENAYEIKELYLCHSENPPILDVKQIGTSRAFKIFFEDAVPSEVKLFFSFYKVKRYYKSPVRCYNCCGYGHVAAACTKTTTCGYCGEKEHHFKDCSKTVKKCANCSQPHEVTDKDCTKRAFQIRVHKLVAAENITFHDAKVICSCTEAPV